jgi:tetratricopeptide (TPR) repeat protein
MKHITYIHRTALLSLLSLGFGVSAAQAEELDPISRVFPVPELLSESQDNEVGQTKPGVVPRLKGVENSDPFNKGTVVFPYTANDQGAERLDAQARILFARGETEKAIALQTQAVEQAKETTRKFAETLVKYGGRPAEMIDIRAERITCELETLIIPKIDFEKISIEDAVDFLRAQSEKLDSAEADPNQKGLNFVYSAGVAKTVESSADGKSSSPVITGLHLRNVPLGTVLKYICKLTQYRYSVDNYVIMIEPAPTP